ncbi:MAG TPA: HEAT repeat domain-containing protein [Gemmataceae bacterium]|nr:HEAT repeat domain-containing protein [Gemmataceae bacterium]
MFRVLPLALLALGCLVPAIDAEDPFAGKTRKEWLKVLAEDPSARQRAGAVVALTVMPMRDQASEDAIRDALGDKASLVRLKAIDGVGVVVLQNPKNQSGTLEVLGKVLVNDSSDDVRTHAMEIVKEIRQDDYQRKLVAFVADVMKGDKLPNQRAAAAAVLGQMGPNAKTVINVMVEALKDPEPTVRAAVAEGLGRIGDEAKGSIPKLVLLLKDADAGPRLAAAFALGRIGPEASAAVPDLVNALAGDADANVRKEAARACSLLGLDAKTAIPALAKALREDKSEEVRQQAALALSKMRGDDVLVAIPAMVEAMKKDADKSVRIFAVHALGTCLGDGLRAYVKDMADQLIIEKEGDVRLALVQELGGLGPAAKDALPALNRAVTDVQLSVRDEAKKAVKKVLEKQ